ncbi:MAG: hypothetical protein ACR2IE_09005 [Candidatus Sumerlaeaceae bacterium]
MASGRITVHTIALLLAGLLSSHPGSSAAADKYPVVSATLQPTSATVGQQLKLSLTIVVPELTRVSIKAPFVDARDTTWTIIGKPLVTDEQFGGNEWRRRAEYTLATFETGDIPAPAIEVTYQPPGGGEAVTRATPEMVVHVHSLLPANGTQVGLRDIKAPVALPLPRWIIWAGATVILMVAGLVGWFLWKRMRARVGAMLRPVVPFDEWALSEIARAESDRLIEQKKMKELYTRLTDVIRQYYGNLHQVHALDMTTGELLFHLQDLEYEQPTRYVPAFREARTRTEDLLAEADLVKFAKLIPDQAKCRQAIDTAREIVRLTRYKLEPVQPDEQNNAVGHPPPPPPPPPIIPAPPVSRPHEYTTQTFHHPVARDTAPSRVE